MKGLIGKKIGMSHIFDEKGIAIPVTIIEAGPCTVTQIKKVDSDGYNALQLGAGVAKKKQVNKPLEGHFKKSDISFQKYLKEFRINDVDEYKVGQKLTIEELFEVGERVDVVGTSKGKGFAGAVKRWGFSGGSQTHGSMHKRKPASGGSTDAARTFKGKKRPGRMGGRRVTVQGLKIVKIYTDKNLILLKGAVPGSDNGFLLIKQSVKN